MIKAENVVLVIAIVGPIVISLIKDGIPQINSIQTLIDYGSNLILYSFIMWMFIIAFVCIIMILAAIKEIDNG